MYHRHWIALNLSHVTSLDSFVNTYMLLVSYLRVIIAKQYLANIFACEENVPSGQVSMNVFSCSEVLHPISYMPGVAKKLGLQFHLIRISV